jgi:hypothetical protein
LARTNASLLTCCSGSADGCAGDAWVNAIVATSAVTTVDSDAHLVALVVTFI